MPEMIEKPVAVENPPADEPTNTPKDAGNNDDISDFNFNEFATAEEIIGGLDDDENTGDEGKPSAAPEEPAPKTEVMEETPPTPVPAPPPEQPSTPAPTAEPTVPAQPEAVPDTAPQPTSEELNQQYQDWFRRGSDFLVESVYKLDPETKTKLDTNPSEVIPQLAAQLHMQVLAAATTQAANLFMTMLPQMQERLSYEKSLEDQFYDTYKELKSHTKTVDNISKVYRQMNPNATPEQAMQHIAAMAMVQLNIVPPQMQTQVQMQVPPAAVTPTSARGPSGTAPAPSGAKSWVEELVDEED